jgi:hypothetical protein
MISYRAAVDLFEFSNGQLMQNATWNRENGIQALPNRTIQAARRYFRIGTTEASIFMPGRIKFIRIRINNAPSSSTRLPISADMTNVINFKLK